MKEIKTVSRMTVVGLTALCLLLGHSSVWAKGPGGGGHGAKKGWEGKNIPPGWSHGKKTGWQGAQMPPGLAKSQGEGAPEEGK